MQLELAFFLGACPLQSPVSPPAVEPAPDLGAVLELEITGSEPALGEHGPAVSAEYTCALAGVLHAWAQGADLDLFLAVEQESGATLAEDDDSGGRPTPYVRLDVREGQWLGFQIAARRGTHGPVELHLVLQRENEDSREAAARVGVVLAEVSRRPASEEPERARRTIADLLDEVLPALPGQASSLLEEALWRAGWEAHELGALDSACRAWGAVLEVRERCLPGDHRDLLNVQGNLGVALWKRGDARSARELLEHVRAGFSRTLAPDHPDLATCLQDLALIYSDLGELAKARELEEEVLRIRTLSLPPDHLQLQSARLNLAIRLKALGDLARARELEEQALEVCERTQSEESEFLLVARSNTAITLEALGDLDGARRLEESVLRARARLLPEDHPHLLSTRNNLAITMRLQGDLAAAREILERVLEVRTRVLPADHPELQASRLNLAAACKEIGDYAAARELEERVVETLSRTYPSDHPLLQDARGNLAVSLKAIGDPATALALEREAVDAFTRTQGEDSLSLQRARTNLAMSLYLLGDFEGASDQLEAAWAALARTVRNGHRWLQSTQAILGLVNKALGRLDTALELERAVAGAYSDFLPDDHPLVQAAKSSLAWTTASMGDRSALEALLRELATGLCASSTARLGSTSPRELEDCAIAAGEPLATLLCLTSGAGLVEPFAELDGEVFTAVEALRGVGFQAAALRVDAAADPVLAQIVRDSSTASREVARLLETGADSDTFHAARRRLESLRRELASRLSSPTGAASRLALPTNESLGSVLGTERRLISYRRYRRTNVSPVGNEARTAESLVAFVVGERELERVELGPIEPIERAGETWLAYLRTGGGDRAARGVGVSLDPPASKTSGERLRELVFDPLRPALGEARRLVVLPDDVLNALPLDALPEGQEVLGDRVRIEMRLSSRELLWKRKHPDTEGDLLALGGATYSGSNASDPTVGDSNDLSRSSSRGGLASLVRGRGHERSFAPLPASLEEVEELGALFAGTASSEAEVHVLTGHEATRDRLEVLAPRARWIHIATHGWFAPESIRSSVDARPLDAYLGLGRAMGRAEEVRGMNPLLLCGLALAGADRSEDEFGRVEGLVTAEEISTWDLSNCELAVLSACDTNVGLRRAGQGVASLQQALHMAGARSVITSLWKVPDGATKELMIDFYRRIWLEKRPKHQALWEAKMKLRAARDQDGNPRYTPRDWAAWVLTGEPD